LLLVVVSEGVSLEGVLHRTRGRDDRPATTTAEPACGEALEDVGGPGGSQRNTLPERASVAAVEEEHDASRPGGSHAPLDEVGRDRRGSEPVRAGVAGSEEQLPRVVLQAVTREVEQQQVIGLAVREEVLDAPAHDMRRLVVHHLHVEVADVLVPQDLRQRFGVGSRRPQAAQPRILVLVAGDDERAAPAGHDLLLGVPGEEHLDEAVLLLARRPGQLQDVTGDLEPDRAWRVVPTSEPAEHRRYHPSEALRAQHRHDELADRTHVEAPGPGRGWVVRRDRSDIGDVELAQLIPELSGQGVEAGVISPGLRQGDMNGRFIHDPPPDVPADPACGRPRAMTTEKGSLTPDRDNRKLYRRPLRLRKRLIHPCAPR